MGIRDWFKTSTSPTGAVPIRTNASPTITASVGMIVDDLQHVSGTTTVGKQEAQDLAVRHSVKDARAGYFTGLMQREPENPKDASAIAIRVEGGRIGYLSSYVASALDLQVGVAQEVPVQVWATETPRGLRVEAWVWLGSGTPKWEFDDTKAPPMTADAKHRADHDRSSTMVREALAGGGQRAKHFERGMVDGVHYLELVEPIKELKRQGRNEDALELCLKAIEGAENDLEFGAPAPWYTIQAAIVYRKLGQRDLEIGVLKRWMHAAGTKSADSSEVAERLRKLRS